MRPLYGESALQGPRNEQQSFQPLVTSCLHTSDKESLQPALCRPAIPLYFQQKKKNQNMFQSNCNKNQAQKTLSFTLTKQKQCYSRSTLSLQLPLSRTSVSEENINLSNPSKDIFLYMKGQTIIPLAHFCLGFINFLLIPAPNIQLAKITVSALCRFSHLIIIKSQQGFFITTLQMKKLRFKEIIT